MVSDDLIAKVDYILKGIDTLILGNKIYNERSNKSLSMVIFQSFINSKND